MMGSLRSSARKRYVFPALFLAVAFAPGGVDAREGQVLLHGGRTLYGELVDTYVVLSNAGGIMEVRSSEIVRIRPSEIELATGVVVQGRLAGGVLRVLTATGPVSIPLGELLEFRVLKFEPRSGGAGLPGPSSTQAAPVPSPGSPTSRAVEPTIPRSGSGGGLEGLFAAVSPSVAVILMQGADGAGQGTGFVVRGGFIATNYHVVKDAERIEIVFADGSRRPAVARAAGDEEWDLALLVVENLPPPARPLALGRTAQLRIGHRIAVVGAPLGLSLSLSDGLVAGLRGQGTEEPVLQITAPISQGSSGSPVFTLDGTVVGMATMFLAAGQNLNFAVPAGRIDGLIDDALRRGPRAWGSIARRETTIAPSPRLPEATRPGSSNPVDDAAMAAFVEILPLLDLSEQIKGLEGPYQEAVRELGRTLSALGEQRFEGDVVLRRALGQLGEVRRLAAEEERLLEQMSGTIDRFVAKLAAVPRSRATDLSLLRQQSETARDASRHAAALRRETMTRLERALTTLRGGRPGRFTVVAEEFRQMQALGKKYQLWLAESERRWSEVGSSLEVVAKQVGAR